MINMKNASISLQYIVSYFIFIKTNKIEYKTDPTEASNTRCPVQVQKETKDGMEDAICGELSPKGYAGYCK